MSAQYWPSEGSAEYDSMSVTKQDEKQLRGYTIRKFSLTNKKVLYKKDTASFGHIFLLYLLHLCNKICCIVSRPEDHNPISLFVLA